MNQTVWLTEQFEENRAHLRAVAYRMLGSGAEADDAMQEAWIRVDRADSTAVENVGGWLTTIVSRVCLDMLRSRRRRREDATVDELDLVSAADHDANPENDALIADAVGPALLVVLETLSPAERLAFVLHDTFAVPFEDIARIIGRSPTAARQLASRARRRVQGAEAPDADPGRQRAIVDAFLAASRNGEFDRLLELLDPQVELHADAAAVATGASDLVRGAAAVAGTFSGRARAARLALVDGVPGAVWMQAGRPRVVFGFTIVDDAITAIELLADEQTIADLELTMLDRKTAGG
jgi:RNA polymerase sigma-70 factor (ECF subfamily)